MILRRMKIMNNIILEMDVAEAFAEYETLCAIGDCINKQILMESYIQEADNETTTDNIPAPDVTTFQKFKNWISQSKGYNYFCICWIKK
jgi:hypothetical protein